MIPIGAFAKAAVGDPVDPNPPEITITPANVTIAAAAATVIDLSPYATEVGTTNGLTLTGVAAVTKGTVVVENADEMLVRYTPPTAGLADEEVVRFDATVKIKTTAITGTIRVTATAQTQGSVQFTHRHRVVVTPQAAQVGDFVACVRLSDPLLRTVANGGAMRSATAADVKVETEAGQTVPFIVDQYDPATGALILHVRFGTLIANQALPIVVKWGRDGAPGYANAGATWAGWLAKWKFPSGTDLTGNGRALTMSNVPSTTGAVGVAGDFGATSDAQLANIAWLNGLAAITVVGLVRNDLALPINRGFIAVGSPSGEDPSAPLMIRYMSAGDPGLGGARDNVVKARLATDPSGSGAIESTADQARSGAWSQVALAWAAGSNPRINVDGAEVFSESAKAFSGVTAFGGGPLYIGRSPTGAADNADRWDGAIDEVGIVAGVLSTAYLKALWDAVRDQGNRLLGKGNAELVTSSNGPVALPKQVSVAKNGSIDIGLGGLTYRPPGMPTPLTHTITTAPAHGTATLNGTVVTYRPATDYVGADEFVFRASAGGKTSSAKVWITVTGGTEPPPPPPPPDPDDPGDEGDVGWYPPVPTFNGPTYYVRPGGSGLSTNRSSPGAAQTTINQAPSGSTIIFLVGTYPSLNVNRPGVNLHLRADVPVFTSIDTARRTSVNFDALPGQVVKNLKAPAETARLRGLSSTDAGDLVVEGFYGQGPNEGKFNMRGRGRLWFIRNYLRDTNNECLQALRATGTPSNKNNWWKSAVYLQNWVRGDNYTVCNPNSPYYAYPGNPSGSADGCPTPTTQTGRAWTDYGIYVDGVQKVYIVKNLSYGIQNHLMSVKRLVDAVFVDQNLFIWPDDVDARLHASAQVGQEQDVSEVGSGSSNLKNVDQTIGPTKVRFNTFYGRQSTAFWIGNVVTYEATDNYIINCRYVVKSHVDGYGNSKYALIGPKQPGDVLIKNNLILRGDALVEAWTKGTDYTITLQNNDTPNQSNPVRTRLTPFEDSNYPSSVPRIRPKIERVGGSASGFAAPQNV